MVITDMSDNRVPLRVRVKSNDKLPKRVKVNVVALIMNSNPTLSQATGCLNTNGKILSHDRHSLLPHHLPAPRRVGRQPGKPFPGTCRFSADRVQPSAGEIIILDLNQKGTESQLFVPHLHPWHCPPHRPGVLPGGQVCTKRTPSRCPAGSAVQVR